MPMRRLFLSGPLLPPACGTSSAIQRSEQFAQIGDHDRAFHVLEQQRNALLEAGSTPSAEFEAAYATAQRRYLLERARWEIFGEQEQKALETLAELERLAPEYPELDALRQRAIRKQALQAVQLGDEMLLRKDLEGALTSYLRAESLQPGLAEAIDGSENVRLALGKLSDKAQRQFLEAVRKLPEFRFVEVRWHSDIAFDNAPEREDAEQLSQRAQRELAQKALERGRECLDDDQFGAALLEFRNARKLDPDLEGIDARIAEVEQEVRAATLMAKAQVAMRGGNFEIAREQLDEAFAISTLSRGGISELMLQLRRREGDMQYQAARDLEILGKKEAALAAYEALAQKWPDGFEDEQARIEGLKLDIDSAKTEWAAAEAAEAAGDAAAALQHYRAAMQFYPGWQDGAARIERLQRVVGAESPSAGDGLQR